MLLSRPRLLDAALAGPPPRRETSSAAAAKCRRSGRLADSWFGTR